MNLNKRQQAIVDFARTKKSFQTKDAFLMVGKGYSVERLTIVRDLRKLEKEHIIEKTGEGRLVHYSLSGKYRIAEDIPVEEYFSIRSENRDIIPFFNFEIFQTLDAEIFTASEKKALETLHAQFIKNFSKYTSQTIINKEFERILIEFSWKSSQIEGNTYSLLSTERLIRENIPEAGKTREETQMILNHKDAFNEILQNREEFIILKKQNIDHIHRVLTKDLSISANFRSHPVGITGTNYRPLDTIHQIEEAFEKMILLINSRESFFEKSFLLLLLISYIQAFEDGNKRTARMTSNAVLLAFQSIPMSYRAVDEVEYKKASLLFYEQNNFSYFKKIFLEQYTFAVHNYFL
jgi:Fic family protein